MAISGGNTYTSQLRDECAVIIATDQFHRPWYDEEAVGIVGDLLPELQKEETTLDTDTGVVTFRHPYTGEETERDLQQWVAAEMTWRDTAEIVWDAIPTIVHQLCSGVIEVNNG